MSIEECDLDIHWWISMSSTATNARIQHIDMNFAKVSL
jgi:hypothetical protein